MTDYEYFTLDVFTDTVFGGNPLAVLVDARGLSGAQMQRIANEFNLSETAFVLPASKPDAARRVRIFTPRVELPFAGHPTIGTAVLLVDRGIVPATGEQTSFVLEEGVGDVAVTVTSRGGRAVAAQLTAVGQPTFGEDPPPAEVLAEMLSLPAAAVRADDLRPRVASAGVPFTVVPLVDAAAVAAARLDLERWGAVLDGGAAPMVYVVAVDGAQVRARMFAPSVGVAEDPATGAAASALGGYLGAVVPDGTHTWTVTQGVEMGRPSRLEVEADVRGGRALRVRVSGSAVQVCAGSFTLGPTAYVP